MELPTCPLTDREREVLRAVVNVGSVPAAAEQLICSPHTVNRHLDRMREKVGVHTTVQLVEQAAREGWI